MKNAFSHLIQYSLNYFSYHRHLTQKCRTTKEKSSTQTFSFSLCNVFIQDFSFKFMYSSTQIDLNKCLSKTLHSAGFVSSVNIVKLSNVCLGCIPTSFYRINYSFRLVRHTSLDDTRSVSLIYLSYLKIGNPLGNKVINIQRRCCFLHNVANEINIHFESNSKLDAN